MLRQAATTREIEVGPPWARPCGKYVMDDLEAESPPVLRPERVTVGDLFVDLARAEADDVKARIDDMPADVMMFEGASALIDAAASLRHAAARLEACSGRLERTLALAQELTERAAQFQQSGDLAAIAIRRSDERRSTET